MSQLEPTRTNSNLTATDRLRAMLDERGGFRVDFDREGARRTCWKIDDEQDGYCYFDEDVFGATQLTVTRITPEQAIAATLGTGTCHVESSIIDTYEYNRWEYELSCGHTIIWEDSEPPRYCPDCGRRVEQ